MACHEVVALCAAVVPLTFFLLLAQCFLQRRCQDFAATLVIRWSRFELVTVVVMMFPAVVLLPAD
jgi:hypothetical protein